MGFAGQLAQHQMWEAFAHPDRTAKAHFRVIVQADRIAFSLTKAEILNGVLDRNYFGHEAHSLSCASAVYFGKPPQSLDVSEAALLAGLVKGPKHYDPARSPDRARDRRAVVIDGLLAAGVISQAESEAAKSKPLPVLKTKQKN